MTAHANQSSHARGAPSAQVRRPAPGRTLSIALLLFCCTPALGWNPYDTDSAQGRGDARPWAGHGSTVPPAYQSWGGDDQAGPRAGSSGLGAPEQSAPGFNDPWATRVRPRYRFRGDAVDDGTGGTDGAPVGLRYRPLTERERARQVPAADAPGFRPQDLQPRGPSWRLEDEGSAFGYHPDHQRFDAIAPPLPR